MMVNPNLEHTQNAMAMGMPTFAIATLANGLKADFSTSKVFARMTGTGSCACRIHACLCSTQLVRYAQTKYERASESPMTAMV